MYRPLALPRPEPGMYVALTLTDEGSEDLARYIGADVGVVRGRFQGARERGLALAVDKVQFHRGDVLAWRGEAIVVPHMYVSSVEERHVSGGRMLLLGGASVLGLIMTYRALSSSGGVGGGANGPGQPR